MTEETKQKAIRYFQGNITRDEEKALLEFIGQSEANYTMFCSWESEWSRQHTNDEKTRKAWEEFESRIIMKDEKPAFTIRWRRRIAAVAAVALLLIITAFSTWYFTNDRPEAYYALTAPMGSKTRLVLPDNSVVWLNAGSTLRYSTAYNHKNRKVELSGEGYFEVSKQNDGKEFTVKTSRYDVVVKGTKFDVSAYKDDKYFTTSLMQGSVLVNCGNDHLMMKPGEMVQLDTNTGELKKTTFNNDTRAWMQNMTDYDEITLGDFAKVLSRQYAVNIHIKSAELKATKISISLRNKETIDDVLTALQRITSMKMLRQGKDIYITE